MLPFTTKLARKTAEGIGVLEVVDRERVSTED